MRSLIVGMGIGQLYKTVLKELGHQVVTVDNDISKGADLPTVDSAILACAPFDTVHICTPNYTHFDIATRIAPHAKIVFVEKPGVANRENWLQLVETFRYTRFMMVKNNMWRDNIEDMKLAATKSNNVEFLWINKDRVPNPGTWFTTKQLAFGGVSRDLLPHLLSLYVALNPNWRTEPVSDKGAFREWELKDLTTTDYGIVKADGVYDVDDFCYMNFGTKWNLQADWRSTNLEARKIEFIGENGFCEVFELGLCPEDAYKRMIADCIAKMDDSNFWLEQVEIDLWIHDKMAQL